MKLETWIYKQALELYPRAYREQFGQAMLETYSDSLKAAKLEGNTWGFHWNTFLDTVKSVSRATMEIKSYNPMARVVAVIGFVMVLMAFSTWFPQTRFSLSGVVFDWIGACFIIGLAVVSKQFDMVQQKWLLPSFAVLVLVKAGIFTFVKLFQPDSLTAFSVPEVDLGASIVIVGLGHLFKSIPLIGAGLFGIAMILDFVQTRKVNLVYLFVVAQVLVLFAVVSVERFFPERIFWSFYYQIQVSISACTMLIFLLICLRLWQQPRASQLKLTQL